MSHEYRHERRLRYDALIRNDERLPAVAYSCWTLALVTVSLSIILLVGLNQVLGV
jgi:hypothetical protein